MRSFAIEESNSPIPARLAALRCDANLMGCHLYEADYGLHHVADLLRFDLRQVLAYVQTGGGANS